MAGSSHDHQLGWATEEQRLDIVGSSSLAWAAVSKDVFDPSQAAVRLWDQAFRVAKIQLDNDLQHFTTELQRADAAQLGKAVGDGAEGLNLALQVTRLSQVVDEFLTLGDSAFQSSLPEVIRWLHNQRAGCGSNKACLKSLYSRLLFLLSRCSRLLSSEADQLPAVDARGSAAAASRPGIVSVRADPVRLTAKLRHLLYGSNEAAYRSQSPAGAGPCGAEPADSLLSDNGSDLHETGEAAEQAHYEQKPTRSRRYRRRSALVPTKCPQEGAVQESRQSCLVEDETAQRENLKRCNTMPVQQAEAMQQLLLQVQRSMDGDNSQQASCYPLQPSSIHPSEDLDDKELLVSPGSKSSSPHPQQHPLQAKTCSKEPRSYASHSAELESFIADQAASLPERQTGHIRHPPIQNALERDLQHRQESTADAMDNRYCKVIGYQYQLEAYQQASGFHQLEALSHEATSETAHTHDTLRAQGRRCAPAQELCSQPDAGRELQQSDFPAASHKRSKGWVRKQWGKLKACAKSIGLIKSVRTLPASPKAELSLVDAMGKSSSASKLPIIRSFPSTAGTGRQLLGSGQVASFSGHSLSTKANSQAASAQSAVDIATTLTWHSSGPRVVAAFQHAAVDTGTNKLAMPVEQRLQNVQEADYVQQAASPKITDLNTMGEVNGGDAQDCIQLSPMALPGQQQQVPQPAHTHDREGKSAEAAVADPLPWPTVQHGLSFARSALREAAVVCAQRRLHHSAPNSRSHSLDGGLKSAQALTGRPAEVPNIDTASPAGAIAQLLLPRPTIRHAHTASLPTSRSSGQLLQDSDTSPVVTGASGSWQYSRIGGSIRRMSSSGLSRHGSSRLSSNATAEPSRMRQQQQQQQVASSLQGSPSINSLKLLKQQRHGSPALPAVSAVTSAVWVEAARAGDVALHAAARQQQLQQGCFIGSADTALTLSSSSPAAFASPTSAVASQARAVTPGGAVDCLLGRSGSPASCLSEDAALRKQVLSRCQSVGGGLACALEPELSPGSATLSSSLLNAATAPGVFPVLTAGASLKGLSAAAMSTYMSPVPGHRTCYYSDSGAVHILDPAAAAASLESSGAVALQARTITCAICANEVLAVATNPHNDLCGMLTAELSKLKGSAATADARLTVLANWMEEQLAHCVWPDVLTGAVQQLVDVGRLVASLQPDGTGTPEYRCTKAIEQVQCILTQWQNQMHAFALSQSNAEVLAEGVADCDIVVTLSLRLEKQMHDKLKWLTEPLPVVSKVDSSGTSTPRTAPVMQVSDFEMICPISRGAYGRVYKVKKRSTGDTFAIKVLTKTELVKKNMVESVTNERNILAMANNPFVVRFYYSFSSPEKLFLVMEYCPGGDLSSLLQHLGRFDEDTARQYIAETVLALEYCHSKGIIHRDLKPDNLLVSSTGHIKLSDFGLSKFGGAAAAEGAAGASLDRQTSETPSSAQFDRSSTISAGSSATGGSTPEASAAAACTSAGTQAEPEVMPSSAVCNEGSRLQHNALAGGTADVAADAAIGVSTDNQVQAAVTPKAGCSSNDDQWVHQQQQESLQHGQADKHTTAAPSHVHSHAQRLACMGDAHRISWASASAGSVAAAAPGIRDSYDCYMSPASQAVKASQITRMIPHTSLPSSPAVFLNPGASTVDGKSAQWTNMPLTPAPMLQQLASDLRSENSSMHHPSSAVDKASSQATAVQAPQQAADSAHASGCSDAELVIRRCQDGENGPSTALQHDAAPEAASTYGCMPSQLLQVNASAVTGSCHEDPAAAISAEIAQTAAAQNLVQLQTGGDLNKGMAKRSTSWQSLLIKQQSAPMSSRVAVAGQQLDCLQPGEIRQTLSVADADCSSQQISSQQMAQVVTRAAHQPLSVQRDGGSSIAFQGSQQQQLAALGHSQPLSAPVSAAQLQQRLQAMSDKLLREEQEHQQLLAKPQHRVPATESHVARECIADDAVVASISITGAENAAAEQLCQQPTALHSHGPTYSDFMSSIVLSKLSLQKSLSVALPPELQTPEDAIQVCLPADDTRKALSTAEQKATVESSALTFNTGQQQPHTAADLIAAQVACQEALTQEKGCLDQQQSNVTESMQPEDNHGSTQQHHTATLTQPLSASTHQPYGMKKLKHASQLTHRALGTPDYLAPERLMGMTYGPEVDWWALGVILYEFVYGAPPFNADTPQEIFERILDGNVEFLLDEDGQHVVSEECRGLITQLLQGNSEKRLGHRGAGEVKLHPWFQGVEWETLARQKAAFVPLDTADTKDYFVPKPFSKLSIAADLQPSPTVSRAPRDNLSAPGSSRTRRASSSCHSQQLQQTPRCSNCPTTVGSGSNSSLACASTPTSIAAPGFATNSGNSSLSGMVSPASAALYAAGQQQHSWVQKPWTPTSTPRSARGVTPRGVVLPIPPAFVTSGALVANSTPVAAGSSQQRQQAVKHSATIPPTVCTGPVGVEALTVMSPRWPIAAAAANAVQSQDGRMHSGVTASAEGGGAGGSAKSAAVDVCDVVQNRAAHLRSRRRSASQVETKQQQQQPLLHHRWSSRQLDLSAGACIQQQEALAQFLLPAKHKMLSGVVNAANKRSMNSPARSAASSTGGSSSILSPQPSHVTEHASTISNSERSSQAGCDLRSWGSIYSSPASSAGGACQLGSVATYTPADGGVAAVLPPLPSGQQQQLPLACEPRRSPPGGLSATGTAAVSGSASWFSELRWLAEGTGHQQQDQLSALKATAGGCVQHDDSQQQEQQRKPRKSNCSSPQQRLKQQWAQQRLLQQLQQQQECVPVGYARCEGRSAGVFADAQPSVAAFEADYDLRWQQQISSDSRNVLQPTEQLKDSRTTVESDAISMSASAVAEHPPNMVSAGSTEVNPARLSLADAAVSSVGPTVPSQQGQQGGPCSSAKTSKLSISPRMVCKHDDSSARSPANSPRSQGGRPRRRSAAAYSAASSAAVQAAALLEGKQLVKQNPVGPGNDARLHSRVDDASCLNEATQSRGAGSLASLPGDIGLRASADDTGYLSGPAVADSLQQHCLCSSPAAPVDMASSSSSSLPRTLSLLASAGTLKQDSVNVDEAADSIDGLLRPSISVAAEMSKSSKPALLLELNDNSVPLSTSPSPCSRQLFSFSTWQLGNEELQRLGELSGQYLSDGELQGPGVEAQQQQQSSARCKDAGASSGMQELDEGAGTESVTFDACCSKHAAPGTTSLAGEEGNLGGAGQGTATDSDDLLKLTGQQLEEVDAFGDFAAVNVSALQELNIEKQRAEFLGPIQQAVSAGGAAVGVGVACEDVSSVSHLAAAQIADTEVQYHRNMLAQYAAAAAAAGATTPVLDYSGFPAALLPPDRTGSPAFLASEQQWHQQQMQQQTLMLQQQYEQYTGQPNPGGPGNAEPDGCHLDDLMAFDPILAQYGIGAIPPAAVLEAMAGNSGAAAVVAPDEGAVGVPVIDAATGHIVLVNAASAWLVPGTDVRSLMAAEAMEDLTYRTSLLPYTAVPSGGQQELQVAQLFHAGYVSEPILSLGLKLGSGAAAADLTHQMNVDISLAGLAQVGEAGEAAGVSATGCIDGPGQHQQQQSGSHCRLEGKQQLPKVPGSDATETAAVVCYVADNSTVSSSRRCRFPRASLSTGHLDQLVAAARLSDPGVRYGERQQHARKLGSWSAKGTEPYLPEDDEHTALYDTLLRHGAVAQIHTATCSEGASILQSQGVLHSIPGVTAAAPGSLRLPYFASDAQLNQLQQQYDTAAYMQPLAHAVVPQPPGASAAWLPQAPVGLARSVAAAMSEDGAVRMLSRAASGAAWAPGTGRLSPLGSGSSPYLLGLDNSPAAVGISASSAGDYSSAGVVAAAGVPCAVPAAGKDFLAQLGAIATDGSRGYKYRASDCGHGGSRFLQRSATASLPGTLTGTGMHRSSLSRAPTDAAHDLSGTQEDRL